MATEGGPEETKVSDRGMVTTLSIIVDVSTSSRGTTFGRQPTKRGISPSRLSISVGLFDDFEPVDAVETDTAEVKSEFGTE